MVTPARSTSEIISVPLLGSVGTALTEDECSTSDVVRFYKGLEQAERAFKAFKGPWHLKAAWAPLLFKDENPPTNTDPVAKATRSTAAKRKAQTKHTTTGEPCHSYKSLLSELATLTRNTIRLQHADATFQKLAQPTPLQAHALNLIEHTPVNP